MRPFQKCISQVPSLKGHGIEFGVCSDFDYIRMDMSEQHAKMKDSLSQTVTCYLSAAIHE